MVIKDLIFVREFSNKKKFEVFHTNLIIGFILWNFFLFFLDVIVLKYIIFLCYISTHMCKIVFFRSAQT